jgi:cell division protein FtsZ
MPSFSFDIPLDNARIKVVGVGGAGGNAINRMIEAGLEGVEFISINTDMQVLERNLAAIKIQIGSVATKGLGAGMNPEVGRNAMEESREEVAARLEGADMVFITAGMGGGTGTGAAPVVAEIAREKGILTVAVVTKPFGFEGPQRMRIAREGLEELRKVVDTMIVIPNQKLLSVADRKTTIIEAFRKADEMLYNATRDISTMILKPGLVNVDFADVSSIMKDSGEALMGSGTATGEGRALKAAEMALHSPLLENLDITGATGMLVNFTGSDIAILEADDVMNYFRQALGEEADERTIWGVVDDASVGEEFRVTLIATGFHGSRDATPAMTAIGARATGMGQPQPGMRPQMGAIPVVRDPSGSRLNIGAPTALGNNPAPSALASREPSAVARPSIQAPVTISAAPRPAPIMAGRRTGAFLALPPDQIEEYDESAIPTFMRPRQ